MSDLKLHSRKAEAGVSLIDLCIVLILISLILLPMSQAYNQWRWDNIKNTNDANMGSVDHALTSYYYANNAYPCPADPLLNSSDSAYGKADCTTATDTSSGLVRRGAVPFIDLKIPFTQTLDGYKNKLIFVVTKTQTVPPMAADGAINVTGLDKAGAPVNLLGEHTDPVTGLPVPNKAHYLILSAGEDGVGAYTSSGTKIADCPVGATALGAREAKNCDGGVDFIGSEFTYTRSKTRDLNFYDDTVFNNPYRTAAPTSIWMTSKKNMKNIYSNIAAIGINTTDPQVDLDVNGNILTSSGTIVAGQMCDTNGANCFTPRKIAGSGITCVDGTANVAMVGIKEDDVICAHTLSSAVEFECPQYTWPTGFDASGKIICQQ